MQRPTGISAKPTQFCGPPVSMAVSPPLRHQSLQLDPHEPPKSAQASSPLRHPSVQVEPHEPPASTQASSPLRYPSEHVGAGTEVPHRV